MWGLIAPYGYKGDGYLLFNFKHINLGSKADWIITQVVPPVTLHTFQTSKHLNIMKKQPSQDELKEFYDKFDAFCVTPHGLDYPDKNPVHSFFMCSNISALSKKEKENLFSQLQNFINHNIKTHKLKL